MATRKSGSVDKICCPAQFCAGRDISNKTKPIELFNVKQTLYPFLVKLPTYGLTWDQLYQMHLDDIAKRAAIKANTGIKRPTNAPWKTRKKVETFASKRGWDAELIDKNVYRDGPDSWWMKEQRRLMTHFVGSRYAFVMDYMFSGTWAYCLMITGSDKQSGISVFQRRIFEPAKNWCPAKDFRLHIVGTKCAIHRLGHGEPTGDFPC